MLYATLFGVAESPRRSGLLAQIKRPFGSNLRPRERISVLFRLLQPSWVRRTVGSTGWSTPVVYLVLSGCLLFDVIVGALGPVVPPQPAP